MPHLLPIIHNFNKRPFSADTNSYSQLTRARAQEIKRNELVYRSYHHTATQSSRVYSNKKKKLKTNAVYYKNKQPLILDAVTNQQNIVQPSIKYNVKQIKHHHKRVRLHSTQQRKPKRKKKKKESKLEQKSQERTRRLARKLSQNQLSMLAEKNIN
jgi:hypothetical protein